MLKWFIISIVVLSGAALILLGLGKLLHDNEQRVNSIKSASKTNNRELIPSSELALDNMASESSSPLKQSILKPIIIQNLTCVSDEQCVVVNVNFADLTCQLAINTIGAALLAKAGSDDSAIGGCAPISITARAICQAHLCVIDEMSD